MRCPRRRRQRPVRPRQPVRRRRPPINPANFTGLVTPHATTDIRTLRYEFARGARTNWHSHAGGQVVFVERGRMRTQERGKAVQEFGPGGLVRTEADVVHWHGARPDDGLTQVALSFGVTNWLQPVSEASIPPSSLTRLRPPVPPRP